MSITDDFLFHPDMYLLWGYEWDNMQCGLFS